MDGAHAQATEVLRDRCGEVARVAERADALVGVAGLAVVRAGALREALREPFGQGDELRPGPGAGLELQRHGYATSAVRCTGTGFVTMS